MNPFQQPQNNPFQPVTNTYGGAPQGANPFGGGQPFQPQAPQQFAPQGAMPVDLASAFAGMGDADEGNEKLPPLPQGGHKRIRVGEVKIERSTYPGNQHVIYFKANIEVVESTACAPGTRSIFIEKITGHKFDDYRNDALARIRCFVAGAMGRDGNSPEVRAEFNDEKRYTLIMQGVAAGNLRGKELTCTNVTHKVTKPTQRNPQGGLIASYSWAPLGASVAAASPSPVQPQVATAPSFPPAGWAANPQYPGYFTGLVNGQQFTVSENDLRAAVAAGKV